MGPLPLALGHQLGTPPPLRGPGPSGSSHGVQSACWGVGPWGQGSEAVWLCWWGLEKGARRQRCGAGTGRGRRHPRARHSLANHPHGSWSQVFLQLGRRPGQEPGAPLSAPHLSFS